MVLRGIRLHLGLQVALQLVIVTHTVVLVDCGYYSHELVGRFCYLRLERHPVFMLYLLYRCESGVDNLTRF